MGAVESVPTREDGTQRSQVAQLLDPHGLILEPGTGFANADPGLSARASGVLPQADLAPSSSTASVPSPADNGKSPSDAAAPESPFVSFDVGDLDELMLHSPERGEVSECEDGDDAEDLLSGQKLIDEAVGRVVPQLFAKRLSAPMPARTVRGEDIVRSRQSSRPNSTGAVGFGAGRSGV